MEKSFHLRERVKVPSRIRLRTSSPKASYLVREYISCSYIKLVTSHSLFKGGEGCTYIHRCY